jgi:hypothetical protein
VKTFRAIVWAEVQTPNTDPRDCHVHPAVITRSVQSFLIQTRSQSDAVKQFKASLGLLNSEDRPPC